MSPTLNESWAVWRFERGDAIEIHDGIVFDFYTGLWFYNILILDSTMLTLHIQRGRCHRKLYHFFCWTEVGAWQATCTSHTHMLTHMHTHTHTQTEMSSTVLSGQNWRLSLMPTVATQKDIASCWNTSFRPLLTPPACRWAGRLRPLPRWRPLPPQLHPRHRRLNLHGKKWTG